ncbi:MFS transporter [Streptomyces sp. NPDC052236]|uniref:MFS transporter n=1 Tax=Streptomyces sp. NPDC052236 TaxID=3365686 RepID=UPI0037D0CCB0
MRLFWWASAADAVGSQASGVVLPLLLLGLGYSPAMVGLIAGVSTVAGLVLGPLAAVPADRGARKQVMFWSAVVSALAMVSVAVSVVGGRPSVLFLLGAVLVERFATTCYEAAAAGTVVLICPPGEESRAVARLGAADQGALVLGPALGGVLYQLGRALPFLADAVSYAVAAVCVRAMRSDLKAPEEPGRSEEPEGAEVPRDRVSLVGELVAGLALVRASSFLRLVLVWTTTVNGVVVALYYGAVFTLQKYGDGGARMGLVLAISGAAGLVGSLAAPRVAARVGPPRLLIAVSWALVPLAAGLAAASGALAYGVLFGTLCLLMPLAVVVLQARAIQMTAPGLQARTGAVLATAAGGAAALAPVLAGVFAARSGTAAPALGCAVLLAALALHTTWRSARGTVFADVAEEAL